MKLTALGLLSLSVALVFVGCGTQQPKYDQYEYTRPSPEILHNEYFDEELAECVHNAFLAFREFGLGKRNYDKHRAAAYAAAFCATGHALH